VKTLTRTPNHHTDQVSEDVQSAFPHHTVIRTILTGVTPGSIYADDSRHPEIIFAQFKHQCFLCGNSDIAPQINLPEIFRCEVLPNAKRAGVSVFKLMASSPDWIDVAARDLTAYYPFRVDYQCYQYQITSPIAHVQIPDGFHLVPVTKALVDSDFYGKEVLLEEMCSERESVDAFLRHSFGVVAFDDARLAGWCLSEYNHETRCEVGVATAESHRRKGLAKAMTHELINLAYEYGIDTILWHCTQRNVASANTALSAGFELVAESPVLFGDFNEQDR